MSTDESELRRAAAAMGLPKLDGKHLTQLEQAMVSTRDLGARLPKDLHWSEELALTFRLSPRREAKP